MLIRITTHIIIIISYLTNSDKNYSTFKKWTLSLNVVFYFSIIILFFVTFRIGTLQLKNLAGNPKPIWNPQHWSVWYFLKADRKILTKKIWDAAFRLSTKIILLWSHTLWLFLPTPTHCHGIERARPEGRKFRSSTLSISSPSQRPHAFLSTRTGNEVMSTFIAPKCKHYTI